MTFGPLINLNLQFIKNLLTINYFEKNLSTQSPEFLGTLFRRLSFKNFFFDIQICDCRHFLNILLPHQSQLKFNFFIYKLFTWLNYNINKIYVYL